MSKSVGMDDMSLWKRDKPTKPTVGSAKPQNKYYPRPKKGNPTMFTKTRNSRGKKANAVSAPFYGRSKRK